MTLQKGFIRRRPFSCLMVIIVLILAALILQYRVQLRVFPDIISGYTAKEYCSCRYVVNQPADYCRAYVKQWLSSTLNDDPVKKAVRASGLGRTTSAAWVGQREGCRLVTPVP
jgi:hypothetical protein